MIQRIQSIYLFLAFLALALLFLFPVLSFDMPGKANQAATGAGPRMMEHRIYAFEETVDDPATAQNPDSKSIYTENSLVILLCMLFVLGSIFLYSNRKRQIALCWLAVLCMLVETLMVYFKINPVQATALHKSLGIGAFMLSVALLLTLLARRNIQKDETLVRSADRLR